MWTNDGSSAVLVLACFITILVLACSDLTLSSEVGFEGADIMDMLQVPLGQDDANDRCIPDWSDR